MRVPYQTNIKLLPAIRKNGCALLSVLYLTGRNWTVEEVNQLYQTAVDKRAMTSDCYITWKPFLELVGGLKLVRFESATYRCGVDELELQLWHSKETGDHFVVGNGGDGVTWDPWPYSATVKKGKIKEKRILKKVVVTS